MPITEFFSSATEIEFGCGTTFQVEDHVLLSDRRLAHALNHLYNHIHYMIGLATTLPLLNDYELDFLISNHPLLREQALELKNLVPNTLADFNKMDDQRLVIVYQLIEETKALTEITALLACSLGRAGQEAPGEKGGAVIAPIDMLERSLAQIPFIDYHLPVEDRPSIVKLKNI